MDFQTRRPWKSFTFKQRAEQGREINTNATRQTEKCQHLKEAAREPRASAGSADSTNGCDGFAFHGGCGEPPAPFLLSHVHIQVPLSPSPPVPSSAPPPPKWVLCPLRWVQNWDPIWTAPSQSKSQPTLNSGTKLLGVGIHKIRRANPSPSDSPFQVSFAASFMRWSSTTKKKTATSFTTGIALSTLHQWVTAWRRYRTHFEQHSTSTATAQCSRTAPSRRWEREKYSSGDSREEYSHLQGDSVGLGGIRTNPKGTALAPLLPPGTWRAFIPRSLIGNWN